MRGRYRSTVAVENPSPISRVTLRAIAIGVLATMTAAVLAAVVSQFGFTPEVAAAEVAIFMLGVTVAAVSGGLWGGVVSALLASVVYPIVQSEHHTFHFDQAQQLIAAMPTSVARALTQVSPSAYLGQVHAHLYLMHDLDDSFIPFTESRDLVALAPPGVIERYTEFSIFAHVIPDRPVPWQTFLPDLWRLYWHVHAVMLEIL